jgi:hypothetical protein
VGRFEAANVSSLTTATADAPLVALRAPAAEVMKLVELGIMLTGATSSVLGLARATTASVTPATTKPGRNLHKGGADSGSLLVSSWTTAPVISTNYLRQAVLPAAIGAGIVWTWPQDRPLEVGDGIAITEVVITNLVAIAPSVFRYWAIWED